MNLFFDTSALVKFFHKEAGSSKVEELILNNYNNVWIINLARIEFASALHRRYRNRELSKELLDKAMIGFAEQLKFFNVEPMGISITEEAEKLIMCYGQQEGLRTLDSLQLAAFSLLQEENWYFVCSDLRLLQIAQNIGFNVIDPLS